MLNLACKQDLLMRKQKDERGVAPVLVVLGVVLFLGVAGLIVWRVMTAQQQTANTATNEQKPNAYVCDYTDQDLCKFFNNWQQRKSYKLTMTQVAEGVSTTNTFEATEDGKRFHSILDVATNPYETIVIDSTSYIKDNVDGKWWRQVSKPEAIADSKAQYDPEFDATQGDQEPAKRIEYKKLEKEACGQLQCFKYQIVDPASTGTKEYLWFDDKDYQLRKMRTEASGMTMEQVFSYEPVTINVPAPIKELGPNQFFMPGSSEPQNMPQ